MARTRNAAVALAFAAFLVAACLDQDRTVPEPATQDRPRPDGPSYTLRLQTSKGAYAITGRETTWDPEIGAITLGPEERTDGPLAQLILRLTGGYEAGTAFLTNATLSTTDRRVGTADELNAMLFGGRPIPAAPDGDSFSPWCTEKYMMLVAGVGSDYIEGSFCFGLPGLEPADVPPDVLVYGTYAAFSG